MCKSHQGLRWDALSSATVQYPWHVVQPKYRRQRACTGCPWWLPWICASPLWGAVTAPHTCTYVVCMDAYDKTESAIRDHAHMRFARTDSPAPCMAELAHLATTLRGRGGDATRSGSSFTLVCLQPHLLPPRIHELVLWEVRDTFEGARSPPNPPTVGRPKHLHSTMSWRLE